MGTGRRTLKKSCNMEYKEKEVQAYCLFCNNSIYIKDVLYCNTFCNNADLYGARQALVLWNNDNMLQELEQNN